MEIILKKDVDSLGIAEDLVSVKPGFARNYLIPQGFAVRASKEAIEQWEARKEERVKQKEAMLAEYKEISAKLSTASIKIGAKVGTTDKIFGSVTTHHIAEAIKNQLDIDVDRRVISLPEGEIKTLGSYKANIELHKEVKTEINFTVEAE